MTSYGEHCYRRILRRDQSCMAEFSGSQQKLEQEFKTFKAAADWVVYMDNADKDRGVWCWFSSTVQCTELLFTYMNTCIIHNHICIYLFMLYAYNIFTHFMIYIYIYYMCCRLLVCTGFSSYCVGVVCQHRWLSLFKLVVIYLRQTDCKATSLKEISRLSSQFRTNWFIPNSQPLCNLFKKCADRIYFKTAVLGDKSNQKKYNVKCNTLEYVWGHKGL